MDIDKWMNENAALSGRPPYTGKLIREEDLLELLKTHTIVPNEPTEAMMKTGYQASARDIVRSIYKAMLEASKEG